MKKKKFKKRDISYEHDKDVLKRRAKNKVARKQRKINKRKS